ncbi:penicillin-binding protein 2 [Sungkyunkwania multivorans]|uniref:Penicillin-binding protein 2 n=1 Tax=Sungkyunkwania multivorans TaxID=1173618 RepID=A0ABW3D2B3_9FLAO
MRKLLLYVTVLLIGLIYIGRLSYLQLFDTSARQLSDNNAIKKLYDYPKRGYIYDRNGKLLVANQPAYDIMVIPREVKPLDTTEFCRLLKINKKDFIKRYKKARTYSPWIPSVFLAQLSKEDYASLQEKMRKFDGFYIQKRQLRDYQTEVASNVLGYISEVNEGDLKKYTYYQQGELIGRQGVEKAYEDILRGKKGVKRLQKDKHNRIIGPYKEGRFDTLPVSGKDIRITLDIELQEYGEMLMKNKRGGIVAIEPSTGEILSLVTAPSYDPAILVGRVRSKNFTKLYNDSINIPLFDRGLKAQYAPGSPFKTINALIALEEGVIGTNDKITCFHGHYFAKGQWMGCHCPSGTRNNMNRAVYESCNTYFANVYRRIIDKDEDHKKGLENWKRHVNSFGLGKFLGNDLPVGSKGHVPGEAFYNKWYGERGWRAVTTVSNAIGQGEVLATPIQLANMTAAIANRGYYYTPHVIKDVEGQTIDPKFTTKNVTTISPENFTPVIQGMHDVVEKGTAKIARIPGIEVCGKTGTAENFTTINGEKTQLTDHSIFVAFAPKENPKIAIAVFIENGYWGSRWAAPIASLMIEKHLTGEVSRGWLEERMLLGSLQEEYAKPLSGEPFEINE